MEKQPLNLADLFELALQGVFDDATPHERYYDTLQSDAAVQTIIAHRKAKPQRPGQYARS